MALTEAGTEGLGISIRDLASYFCSENGLVASTQPERLQQVLDVLAGIFEWFGLKMNTRKMVSMAFQPYHTPGRMLVEAYDRLARRAGLTFQER